MISQLIVPDSVDRLNFVSPARVSKAGRIYGGQVFAQAVMAAAQTVGTDRRLHSAHAYFLRGGDDSQPANFAVSEDFDGGRFSNRRVVTQQNDEVVLTLTASFHREGPTTSAVMSPLAVSMPEDAVRLTDYLARLGERHLPDRTHIVNRLEGFDVRVLNGPLTFGENVGGDHVRLWFRMTEPLSADQSVQRGLLAYFSDFTLLASSLQRDRTIWSTDHVQMATIDHALWVHRRVEMGDWLLYESHSPWRADGRGFSRGQIYSSDGGLVASIAQEGVVRIAG